MGSGSEDDDYAMYDPREGRKYRDGMSWVGVGSLLGLGGLAYMVRNFKNRGDTKVSVYLIHTRMLVQGSVIAALTGGMIVQMVSKMRKR